MNHFNMFDKLFKKNKRFFFFFEKKVKDFRALIKSLPIYKNHFFFFFSYELSHFKFIYLFL